MSYRVASQTALVLQEGAVRPIDALSETSIDIRLRAATNRNLAHIAVLNLAGTDLSNVYRCYFDLVVIPVANHIPRVVATAITHDGNYAAVSWSPDGKLLSYTSSSGDAYVVSLNGNAPRKVTEMTHPSFADYFRAPAPVRVDLPTIPFLLCIAVLSLSEWNQRAERLEIGLFREDECVDDALPRVVCNSDWPWRFLCPDVPTHSCEFSTYFSWSFGSLAGALGVNSDKLKCVGPSVPDIQLNRRDPLWHEAKGRTVRASISCERIIA